MILTKTKFKWWYSLIIGFLTVIDGLVMLITLGNFSTSLCLKYSLYGASRKIYKK
jgi:EamA domain-containing membrane protein RarD